MRRFVLKLALCYFVSVFSVLLALRLPRLRKGELILVFFVLLLICACLVLSVSSSSWCLGWAAAYNCGTHWTFLLHFFEIFDVYSVYVLSLIKNFYYNLTVYKILLLRNI